MENDESADTTTRRENDPEFVTSTPLLSSSHFPSQITPAPPPPPSPSSSQGRAPTPPPPQHTHDAPTSLPTPPPPLRSSSLFTTPPIFPSEMSSRTSPRNTSDVHLAASLFNKDCHPPSLPIRPSFASSFPYSRVFPFLLPVLFLLEVTLSASYAFILVSYAKSWDSVHRGLPMVTWAIFLLVGYLVSGITINYVILVLQRNHFRKRQKRSSSKGINPAFFLRVLLCLLPGVMALRIHWQHLRETLQGQVTATVMENASHAALLHALVCALPQIGMQGYFFLEDFTPKDSAFAACIPVISICVLVLSASSSYAFFILYRISVEEDEVDNPIGHGQSLLVLFSALFILGSRSFSVSLVASAYWPWIGVLCPFLYWLLSFNGLTFRVRRRGLSPWQKIPLRTFISLLESMTVASTWWTTVALSICYVVLPVLYVIQFPHGAPTIWILIGVTFVGQALGIILVLPIRKLYKRAYKTFVRSLFTAKAIPQMSLCIDKEQDWT